MTYCPDCAVTERELIDVQRKLRISDATIDKAGEEITRLRAERDSQQRVSMAEMQKNAALKAENEALKADAEFVYVMLDPHNGEALYRKNPNAMQKGGA